MKKRLCFVSNSSSSSFIIAGGKGSFVEKYGLTKEDFVKAFAELGVKPEMLYDKKIPEDLKHTKSRLMNWLKDWGSPVAFRSCEDGKLHADGINHYSAFKHIIDCMCREFGFSEVWSLTEAPDEIVYDGKGEFKEYKPASKTFTAAFKSMKKACGVVDNYEVLQDDLARFFIHFDENDVHCIKGFDELGMNQPKLEGEYSFVKEYNAKIDGSKWESFEGSIERFCEILFNYFKEKGGIKSKTATWRDLMADVMTYNLFEG